MSVALQVREMALLELRTGLLSFFLCVYPGPAGVVNSFVKALVELFCGDGNHHRGHFCWAERESSFLRASLSWGQRLAHPQCRYPNQSGHQP